MRSPPVIPVEELGVLVDGRDYYLELYQAMLRAERSIVMSGWQFDSGVHLVRGDDVPPGDAPVEFLPFLKYLCETRPWLKIWILAWDFHPVFVMEREWLQKLIFDWTVPDKLSFLFDSTHVEGASHHQKFVTIDGEVSFLGGLDVCEDRWDDRRHQLRNPLRVTRGEPHKPFHDVQVFIRGNAFASHINRLFMARWDKAGGEPFDPALLASTNHFSTFRLQHVAASIPVKSVTVCRTDPHGIPDGPVPCTEVLAAYQHAIAAAEEHVYVETQYFSSRHIADAFEARMRDASKSTLDLTFIINIAGETLKETIAVGLSQAANIDRLRRVAAETGHRLGFYITVPGCGEGESPGEVTTYMHSKLMIVDDRWLCLGSANLTNRSMAVDTELNITVTAEHAGDGVSQALRQLRASLLTEHLGQPLLDMSKPVVPQLDALAQPQNTAQCRVRVHPSPTPAEQTALALIDPQKLPFDPDHVEPLWRQTGRVAG